MYLDKLPIVFCGKLSRQLSLLRRKLLPSWNLTLALGWSGCYMCLSNVFLKLVIVFDKIANCVFLKIGSATHSFALKAPQL